MLEGDAGAEPPDQTAGNVHIVDDMTVVVHRRLLGVSAENRWRISIDGCVWRCTAYHDQWWTGECRPQNEHRGRPDGAAVTRVELDQQGLSSERYRLYLEGRFVAAGVCRPITQTYIELAVAVFTVIGCVALLVRYPCVGVVICTICFALGTFRGLHIPILPFEPREPQKRPFD